MNKGILYALTAYILWGLLPIYWKCIQMVPAYEILCHRMIWSFAFVIILLIFQRNWNWINKALQNRKIIITFLGTSGIIALNWFTYIWAVNSGFIVESSLGYFINPLITVLLGVIFLKEKLRSGQTLAIVFALTGVLYLTFNYGAFPWIALTLAFTFGFYGLIRKTASLQAIEGVTFELVVLFIPAILYLVYLEIIGVGSYGHVSMKITVLLSITGVATSVPLIFFAAAAKKTSLTTLGVLQYIAPTLQFLIGVFIYNEDFNRTRFIGFSIIWIALIIYTIESILYAKKLKQI